MIRAPQALGHQIRLDLVVADHRRHAGLRLGQGGCARHGPLLRADAAMCTAHNYLVEAGSI